MIRHDYKSKFGTADKPRLSMTHWLLLGSSLLVSGAVIAFVSSDAEAIRTPVELDISQTDGTVTEELPLSIPGSKIKNSDITSPVVTTPPAPQYAYKEVTVRSGDTLAKIFKRQGLTPRDVYDVVSLGDETKALKRIKPGETISFKISDDSELLELAYKTDITHTLRVTRNDDKLVANEEVRSPEVRTTHAQGTIDSSLYMAAQKAGMSDNLIMELANIFGWDIDFALDIRQGDNFTVIFEEKFLDGEKIGDGSILAANFTNRGNTFKAIRYTDAKGVSNYFTPEGNSMRKAFLRSPVDFRRISSRFQRERYHPVLGKKRPHRGVDYAASTGTPVKSSGDGKIIFRGKKSGYGNTIIVQHGSQYTTLYAHLSNFKRGQRKGSTVKQGQVIGFVGMSGLATGPHLHYEFRVNGTHRNPLTVKFPDAEPIKKELFNDFAAKSAPILAQLNLLSRSVTTVAQNEF